MKKILILIFSISCFGYIAADDHVTSYGMEGYQCNVADGKDMDDVIKFAEKSLNPYADEYWPAPYNAFIMILAASLANNPSVSKSYGSS